VGKEEKSRKIFSRQNTYKFFGGKIFTATRVVFSSKNFQLAPTLITWITKIFEMW
jgi:hypothetical protein